MLKGYLCCYVFVLPLDPCSYKELYLCVRKIQDKCFDDLSSISSACFIPAFWVVDGLVLSKVVFCDKISSVLLVFFWTVILGQRIDI